MLFRVHNIKWRDGITTVTPDEMYIPAWDKNYDAASQTATKYMAIFVRDALEWTEDHEYWDLRIKPEFGIPGLLGHCMSTLTHCVEQLQTLLLTIETADIKNAHMIRMTHWHIKTTAELFKKVQESCPIYPNYDGS